MTPFRVFISYRRDADAPWAMLVEKFLEGTAKAGGKLSHDHGVDLHIYMDVKDRLGVQWPERIQEELTAANVVVAVIGPKWLAATDKYARRRIDQEDDWVRRELEAALRSECVLLPVLVDGAEKLEARALPESISALAATTALEIRTPYFDIDVQRLLHEVAQRARAHLDGVDRPPSEDSSGDAQWPYPNPPLPVRPTSISGQDLELALHQMLEGWEHKSSPLPEDPTKQRVEIRRELSFNSFTDVLRFMSEVGRFCEAANHHPRWENVYRTLRIWLSTWDIGHQVSQLDLTLAAHIDKVYRDYAPASG